jgi:hypothetical protein
VSEGGVDARRRLGGVRVGTAPGTTTGGRDPFLLGAVWSAFVMVALLLLDVLPGIAYGIAVPAGAVVLAGSTATIPRLRAALPLLRRRVDGRDLLAITVLYVAVVGLYSLAFTVFTWTNTLGAFLSFGGALLLGVAGPLVYTVWVRGRPLRDLGIGTHRWRSTVALGVLFAGVQFALTLWGYDLPRPVDWVPLLVMALTVGVFESVFFRGFVQGRLEASFGAAPAVLGAAGLYGLYHVGYGIVGAEMVFLFGLGVVYAVAYRLTENVLILWPLLTPLGSLFAQLEGGELRGELPWASIAGFGDVMALMAGMVWLARRRERRRTASRPGYAGDG